MTDLLRFSLEQWHRTPEMEIADAYKWLFHAALGGEHAIRSEDGPRRWMVAEWPTLTEPQPGEQEIEWLNPAQTLARVHMRPYRARGGDPETLLRSFVDSARSFHGDPNAFIEVWRELGTRISESAFQTKDWHAFDEAAKAANYPAVHHSSRYEQVYRPHYRVVQAQFLPV